MKQLEKKILDKVYRFEIKRTLAEITLRLFSIIAATTLLLVMVYGLIQQLLEQQTFDVFRLFGEDTETIRANIKDVIETLYYEVPKDQVLMTVFFFVILFALVLLLLNNSRRIKNNIKSLLIYWRKKT